MVFIATYELLKGRIQPQHTVVSFEQHFYRLGDNLLQRDIDIVNTVLRRESQPLFHLRETAISAYNVPSIKTEHATFRSLTRDRLADADPAARDKLVAFAQMEIKQLGEPHLTYEEYESMRPDRDTALSVHEQQRRRAAINNSLSVSLTPAAQPSPPTPLPRQIELETALRMLRISTANSEARTKIIARISVDQALTLAEQIDDPTLQEALLLHVLDG
jgi:hypothetical protein